MHKVKPHKSVEQIAKKHRLDVSFVRRQLKMGIPIEHEHTRDKDLATDIALQHLDEIPDYYTRLKKMEASAKKEHKKFKDVNEEKKGLWDNIRARRAAGKPRKKPGEKGYPKTLDIEEGLKQARKNVGASKCWTGKKVDPNKPTKMKGGEEVPNCVPEQKDHEYSMARSELSTISKAANRLKKKVKKGEGEIEAWVQSKITKAADYIDTAADYVDSGEMKKESVTIQDANGNDYIEFIDIIKPEPMKGTKTFNMFMTEAATPAWTRKSGKSPSGGLNEKGRKSYERENPGSDLKAPSKKVGNPRRASFCARMKGMKKKLTSQETARDPDSRINKSLRAWNC